MCGDEFLEARITPQWIEHWIEPEQRRSERDVFLECACARYLEHWLYSGNGAVGLSRLRRNPSEGLDRTGTAHHVFLNRQCGYSPFRQSHRRRFVAKAHVGQGEISNQIRIFRLLLKESFQFTARLAPTF